MKNTLIIILLILLILGGAWYVFKPVPKSENEIRLEAESKALKDSVNTLQGLYDLEELKNKRLTAELLKSKVVVKRSEDQLHKAKANEKVYLKRIKEQTLAMSEIQADSVINKRLGLDSIPQKVVYSLARLDACDSVRQSQSNVIQSLHSTLSIYDSLSYRQKRMLDLRGDQISLLQSSSQIDKQLLGIKDTKIKKTTRQNRFLKGGIVGAIGVIVALIVKR